MPELVALELPTRALARERILRVWSEGDAFFPIDSRLDESQQRLQLERARPTAIIDAHGERHRLTGGMPVEDGDAYVVLTSGTTGRPKAVVHTHASVRASVEATHERLGFDPTRHRWHCGLPLAHVGGLSVVLRTILTDTPLVTTESLHAEDLRALPDAGVTHTAIVRAALDRIDPTAFASILLGGQAPPEVLPSNVVTTYGMSETGSGVVYDGVPLSQVEIAVSDEGEILLRTPMTARHYRDGTPVARSDGFYATGDLGYVAADGLLVVQGRLKDLINSGGEKIFPGPIEERLRMLDGVADAVVVAVPDEHLGEALVAVLLPKDPSRALALTTSSVKAFVREIHPPWCAPRAVFIASEVPRTNLGKVIKERVVEMLPQLTALA